MKENKGVSKYASIFKASAASGAGFIFGIIPQLLIGMIIFIYGFYLVKKYKNKNKNKNKKNEDEDEDEDEYEDVSLYYYLGIFLVILGSVVCLNIAMGADIISNELFE